MTTALLITAITIIFGVPFLRYTNRKIKYRRAMKQWDDLQRRMDDETHSRGN